MNHDDIVVGAGGSGWVTASHLVRDHGARVLLPEAGKRDRQTLFKMPAGNTGTVHISVQSSVPKHHSVKKSVLCPRN